MRFVDVSLTAYLSTPSQYYSRHSYQRINFHTLLLAISASTSEPRTTTRPPGEHRREAPVRAVLPAVGVVGGGGVFFFFGGGGPFLKRAFLLVTNNKALEIDPIPKPFSCNMFFCNMPNTFSIC